LQPFFDRMWTKDIFDAAMPTIRGLSQKFLASHSNWAYKSKLSRRLEAYLFTYLLGIVTQIWLHLFKKGG